MTAIAIEMRRRAPAAPPVVSVNGRVISRAEIGRELQHHPAARPAEAWQAAARALVVRELLLQEARRLELRAEPACDPLGRRETSDEASIRALIDREVVTPVADEATCRAWYERHPERFRSADLHEVRHILLAVPPGDAAARARTRDDAAALVTELRRAPERFGMLAEARSACPSRRQGGRLGQIGPGQTVPEFERALSTAPLGVVAPDPVATGYGWHVILVERRIAGARLPFAVVHDRIAAWLGERVRHAAIRQYIAILAGRARITGIELPGSASPLVQ